MPHTRTETGRTAFPGSSMSDFLDALTAYAIDPTRWVDLMTELDRLSDHLERWDPGELVAELSRAESLSWRIKQDGAEPGRTGFAYLLIDAQGRVASTSNNLASLAGYLNVDEAAQIHFTHPASRESLKAARANLNATQRGHSLVSLAHPDRARNRFGFLISRDEFPPGWERVSRTS